MELIDLVNGVNNWTMYIPMKLLRDILSAIKLHHFDSIGTIYWMFCTQTVNAMNELWICSQALMNIEQCRLTKTSWLLFSWTYNVSIFNVKLIAIWHDGHGLTICNWEIDAILKFKANNDYFFNVPVFPVFSW